MELKFLLAHNFDLGSVTSAVLLLQDCKINGLCIKLVYIKIVD